MKTKLFFLGAALFSMTCIDAQDKKLAEECMRKNDYVCAEKQYQILADKELIQKFKSDYYVQLGTAQRRLGKTSAAFKSFESALITNPLSVSVYENLAALHNTKGSRPKALEYINSGLKVEEQNANLYLLRSKVYDNMGKKDLALKDLNYILTFAPDNLFAKTGLATLKRRSGDLEGSLADYNKLLAERPESLLYNGRAEVYVQMKKYKEALADVNKSISIDSKFSQSYVTKAAILFETAKPKEACDNLDKAIALGHEKSLLPDYAVKCIKKTQ